MTERPERYRFHQGDRVLPFAASEYDARLAGLRAIMAEAGVDAAVFTVDAQHRLLFGVPLLQLRAALWAGRDSDGVGDDFGGHRCGSALAALPWRQHHLYGLDARQLLAGGRVGDRHAAA